jgi:hypothetical protein
MSRRGPLLVLLAASIALGGLGALVAVAVLAPRLRDRTRRRAGEERGSRAPVADAPVGAAPLVAEPDPRALAVPARAHGVRPAWGGPLLTGPPR